MKLFSYVLAFTILSVLLCAHSVFAATESTIGSQLSATLTPANAGPGESVAIALQSFETDLRNSTITWTVNGTQVARGIGDTTESIKLGKAATRTTIVIKVAGPRGEATTKTLVIVPQELTLAWEANTYTPSLYRGKALAAPGAQVRMIALPEFKTEGGVKLDPKNLTYRWKKGFEDIENGSGKGIQTVSITTNPLGKTRVSVEVSSSDGTLRGEKVIEIEAVSPDLVYYEERPLLGTNYAARIGNDLSLKEAETTVRVEPFYFSLPLQNLIFSWFVNSTPTAAEISNPELLTVRHERGNSGTARIETSISVPGFLFQEAKRGFTATFGN